MSRPIIGITVSVEVNQKVGMTEQKVLFVSQEHADGVIQAEGVPLYFPFTTDPKLIQEYVEQVDGLILTGGWDIDPQLYGEDPLPNLGDISPERDRAEMALTKAFLQAGKPILGICRGHQLLGVALGCTLYQDIGSQLPTANEHFPKIPRNHEMHAIQIEEDSKLYQILGQKQIGVNSMHHQAIRDYPSDISIVARARDGVIEAFESKQYHNVLGVQWHPECMIEETIHAQKIFQWIVEESKKELVKQL
ncbi:putative glutamine amidotransferase [Seinonella peptonophila]|uniref:Putative glutamine amidotransferase n=1 Tax=Seinonella peptonophila TaxID=112248 RepID=A0A1M4V396_9BACL|nr:gamma-glutamyl-gamma-aminobutyrate hydrolase family protein [Seinonella peptonophila]SHE63399.1 putative glutamine amidotransferase [Seinonella peptonophila]